MPESLECIASLILVAFLWGATNPFLKKGATGLENIKSSSKLGKFFKETVFLFTNLKYLAPFIINQSGSVLYFLTLSSVDLSLAVPVTNSVTFVVTAITGWVLGEDKIHKNTYIGMILILLGVFLCCWDKVDNTVEV